MTQAELVLEADRAQESRLSPDLRIEEQRVDDDWIDPEGDDWLAATYREIVGPSAPPPWKDR